MIPLTDINTSPVWKTKTLLSKPSPRWQTDVETIDTRSHSILTFRGGEGSNPTILKSGNPPSTSSTLWINTCLRKVLLIHPIFYYLLYLSRYLQHCEPYTCLRKILFIRPLFGSRRIRWTLDDNQTEQSRDYVRPPIRYINSDLLTRHSTISFFFFPRHVRSGTRGDEGSLYQGPSQTYGQILVEKQDTRSLWTYTDQRRRESRSSKPYIIKTIYDIFP